MAKGYRGFSFIDIVLRPMATFVYNYFFRLGFLDGREGLLLHLYHAVYVSNKYAKVWELTKQVRLRKTNPELYPTLPVTYRCLMNISRRYTA